MRWWPRWRQADSEARGDGDTEHNELLSAHLDGALSPEETRQAEALLAAAPAARSTLEGLRTTRSALRALGTVPAPRPFTLAAPPSRARGRLPRLELATRVGAVLAAVALVLVLVAPSGSRHEVFTSSPGTDAQPAAELALDRAGTASAQQGFAATPSPVGRAAAPALAPQPTLAAAGVTDPASKATPVPSPLAGTPTAVGARAHSGQGPTSAHRRLLAGGLSVLAIGLGLAAGGQWLVRRRHAQRGQ